MESETHINNKLLTIKIKTMKKLLLFSIMLCCMASLTAQNLEMQQKGVTHRLDSIHLLEVPGVSDPLLTYISVFGPNYLCLSDSVFSVGSYNGSYEYTYNNLNKLLVVQSKDVSSPTRYEYTYNAQGMVTEYITYKENNGNLVLDAKTTTTYNAYNQPLVITNYDRQGNEWVFKSKEEYTYNNDQVVVMIESAWRNNVWNENYKTEFSHNADGDITSSIRYSKASDNSWQDITKNEFGFDQHKNLTSWTQYSKKDGEYVPSMGLLYRYDNNVPLEKVAYSQYLLLAIEELFYGNFFEVHDLIQSVEYYLASEEQTLLNTFYYTNMTDVAEQSDNGLQLWPNPVHETLSLGAENLRQVDIFTIDGKEVMLVKDGFDAIQVSQLANGCYLLKATLNDGSVATQKFIKQ